MEYSNVYSSSAAGKGRGLLFLIAGMQDASSAMIFEQMMPQHLTLYNTTRGSSRNGMSQIFTNCLSLTITFLGILWYIGIYFPHYVVHQHKINSFWVTSSSVNSHILKWDLFRPDQKYTACHNAMTSF